MLLAQLLDHCRNLRKVAMVDCWEEMMFDLEVETTREKICPATPQPSCPAERMASLDLVRIEAMVTDIDVLFRQMVDLRAYHETNRDHHNWDHREEEGIDPRIEQHEGPQVAQCEDQDPTDEVVIDPSFREANNGHSPIVVACGKHLHRLEEVHRECANQPDGNPRHVLVHVHRSVPKSVGVPFESAIVIQVWVSVRDVRVGMVSDDMLVIPSERRREPNPCVCTYRIDTPVSRQSEVASIMEAINSKQPVH